MKMTPYIVALLRSIFMAIAIPAIGISFTSCVHEFPESGEAKKVRLNIVHDLSWSEYEYVYNRSSVIHGNNTGLTARYIIKAYRAGDSKTPVHDFSFNSDDISLGPLTTTIYLPAGDWDIYVWQDLISNGKTFYDASNFTAIRYTKPYTGATDCRDAFEGHCRVTVEDNYDAGWQTEATVPMDRPTAKYEFIATDFNKFYEEVLLPSHSQSANEPKKSWNSLSLQEKQELLKGYSVTAYYPMFMPSIYDMFQKKAIDSERGVRYEGNVEPLNDTEAVIAFDYVFMAHRESSVQIALVLHTPEGNDINMTPVIQVPLLRKRITYVRGKFLTNSVGSGLNIDFSFTDDFNIEIK